MRRIVMLYDEHGETRGFKLEDTGDDMEIHKRHQDYSGKPERQVRDVQNIIAGIASAPLEPVFMLETTDFETFRDPHAFDVVTDTTHGADLGEQGGRWTDQGEYLDRSW